MPDAELQAALPREMYVDPASGRVERDAVLFGEWYCVGRRRRPRPGRPERVVAVDVAGESVLVTSDEDGALHAAYNVCRHRGSQLLPAGQPARDAAALRCPYHSWTYAPRRLGCCRRRTPTVGGPGGVRAAPGRRGDLAGVRLRPPHARPRATPLGRAGRRTPTRRWRNYGLGDLVTGQRAPLRRRGQLQGAARELQRVLPLRPGAPRAVAGWCPSFAGGGADLDWDDGIPHREGAWTFTMTGTTTRAPLPGLDEHERTRHKGDLVYPNLMLSASADHVAAFVLHPRAVDRTEVVCSLLFARDEVADAGVRPERRRRAVGPGQPAGLGDLRVGAARHVVARLPARLVRADGGRQPRHPALAAAPLLGAASR